MKLSIQYLSDQNGTPKAVQVPIDEWTKLMGKLKKYEQALKIKSDLREAFEQVTTLRKSKSKKESLSDFLNEL